MILAAWKTCSSLHSGCATWMRSAWKLCSRCQTVCTAAKRGGGRVVLVAEHNQMLRTEVSEIDKSGERLELGPRREVAQGAVRHVGEQAFDRAARDPVVDECVGVARQSATQYAVGTHLHRAVEQAIGLNPPAMPVWD